ncbi:hypothetical protein L6452_32345 [Arctium lappa]|uniref:Uncharacterized protein n=1 Tax=Arctium lappa TaxID=4217 RepID=A0ACB8Z4Q3_ARCLA|nr:hypothetical protein L6452_32345 [Arctium lappa]
MYLYNSFDAHRTTTVLIDNFNGMDVIESGLLCAKFRESKSPHLHLPFTSPPSVVDLLSPLLQDAEGATEEAEKSNHVVRKLEKRQEERKLDPHVEEKLSGGHVLAAISSRLGHCGRADGELKQLQNMNSNQVGLVCIADCKDLEQLQKMNSSDELWGHNHAECVRVRELYYPDIDTMIENMDDFMMEMAMETDEEEKKEEDRNKLISRDMDAVARNEKKPHVIFIPFPGQSHIKAMLKLAELLHHKGLQITLVNTDSVHKRFLESEGPHCLDASPPGFRFETIPDGISFSSLDDVATARNKRIHSVENLFSTPFLDLLTKFPTPPTCIISDGVMSVFTVDVAQKLGIPIMLYWTLAACGFMVFYQMKFLIEKGLAPLEG